MATKKKKVNKKKSYMKNLLTLMFTFLFLFTCACLFITYKTSAEPSTLIVSVFAFCGLEGGLTAWIKTANDKSKDKKEEVKEDTKEDVNEENI